MGRKLWGKNIKAKRKKKRKMEKIIQFNVEVKKNVEKL